MEPSSSKIPLFTPKSSLIPDLSSPLSNPEDQRSKVGVEWSWEENKAFENALAEFGFESELLLPNLALRIPAKSISQLEEHLKALEDDINLIESSDFEEILNLVKSDDNTDDSSQQGSKNNNEQQEAPKKPAESSRSVPRQRRKGTPWTKTEHEMFLVGLDRYGRGDWRSISKYLVPSKTPTQVASHAQKYFLKLENPKSRPRKDGSFMRTVDDSPKAAATNAQLTISDDKKP